ncbi:MAG: ABC transporter substrate-binding protein [Hyphomicrobiaceae bacterium]|nr:ABC transporter substrate-binding protein [Hyphomicrobiaceae bacterium]
MLADTRLARLGRWAAVALTAVTIAGAGAMGIAEAREQGTTLTWSHPQEPPNWNYWATGASALSVPVFHNVLEPLVELMGDGSVAPLLATEWTVSDDGLTYTFKLRDAKFHDGTDLDAGDVVYSIMKNKESPLANTKVPLTPVQKVEAVDAHTVKLTLSKPSQRLLKELGQTAGIIVPEGSHEKLDLAKGELVGTGPYTFGAYRPDVDLTLNRFDGYWGDKPYFEKIVHRFIPDETAAINALLAGEIDMVASVFGEGLDRLKAVAENSDFKVIIPAPMEINYIFLSTHKKELKDPRVRQAIAYAVNHDDILEGAQAGYGRTVCQWVTPAGEPWDSDYCPYAYDPAKAKALLKEAGQEGLELDFPFITVAEHPVIKDILVEQMAAVGITLKPRALDLATWLEQVNTNGDYEFSNLTSNVKAEAFVCKGGRQPLGRPDSELCDETFDQMAAASDSILDQGEYVKAMAAMTKQFADSAWVIPIHQKATPTLTRSDLVGQKPYRFRVEMDARKLHWASN